MACILLPLFYILPGKQAPFPLAPYFTYAYLLGATRSEGPGLSRDGAFNDFASDEQCFNNTY